MNDLLATGVRLFGALILGIFAYVPLYICYGMIRVIWDEPAKFDGFFIVAFSIASALAYFLCLLTFRAATGRGRKSDGRLLPPEAMLVFFVIFGLIGAAGIVLGIWQGKWWPVLGGVVYLSVVIPAFFRSKVVTDET